VAGPEFGKLEGHMLIHFQGTVWTQNFWVTLAQAVFRVSQGDGFWTL
jgi:hypothetical protein